MKLFLPITSKKTLDLCQNPPHFPGDTLFICSYPKSGTTWMQNIIYQLILLGDTKNNWMLFLDHISLCSPFYENDGTWSNGQVADTYSYNHKNIGIRIFNTHLSWELLPHGKQYKYIYLYRDGKDVVCSFYHHLSHQDGDGEFVGTFKQFLNAWLEGNMAYGKWSDHLTSWRNCNNIETSVASTSNDTLHSVATTISSSVTITCTDNVNVDKPKILYLKYEDMINHIEEILPRIAEFLFSMNFHSPMPVTSSSSASHLTTTQPSIQTARTEPNNQLKPEYHKGVLDKISFNYMQSNISMFQPRSVHWRENFCFIRKGRIGSFTELFDNEDLALYNNNITPHFLHDFESSIK